MLLLPVLGDKKMGEGLCETRRETKVARFYREDLDSLDAERRTIADNGRRRTETDPEVLHRLMDELRGLRGR